MAKFTVDTHIFRELGELLVGRDSTALIELIKNSYDADATEIIVYGEALDDPKRGFITITDDGGGMTETEFVNGFLRVASRLKEDGPRVSKKFKRRYTGAKGIGRLAAHKLARMIQIHSIAWEDSNSVNRSAVDAVIDWDAIEAHQTLDDLSNDAVLVESSQVSRSAKHGTQIKLERLRRRWTAAELGRFVLEVDTFAPPPVLIGVPKGVLGKPLLFEKPLLRDSSNSDNGFGINLDGVFTPSEDYWVRLAQTATWIIEIDARQKTRSGERKVEYGIASTPKAVKDSPKAEVERFVIDHPAPETGPFFQARILIKEGGPDKQVRAWASRANGIRVFMEGFRVLPYGEPKNDWLGLDADYARRKTPFPSLTDFDEHFQGEAEDKSKHLLILPNNDYFGAVFLTQNDASSLRMLVNREGFIPEDGYPILVDLVRKGIDLSVRVRASATRRIRAERREEKDRNKSANEEETKVVIPTRQIIDQTLSNARNLVSEARRLAASGDVKDAEARLSDAINQVENATQSTTMFISEQAMIRVLASVGTQLTGFVHEINGLIGIAEAVDNTLARIRRDTALSQNAKQELGKLHSSIGDLRRSLEKQASYFVDIVTPDARRRRARLNLGDRFEAGTRLVAPVAERRAIEIRNEIPQELKSPPMFPAELTAVFSNLLTNAVKAAGEKGKIRASAERLPDESIRIVVENTGVAVNLLDSERWFKPFESTTENVDPILGQGMGMGLPITRNLLEEYGATIKFVKPTKGYSTAIQIVFQP